MRTSLCLRVPARLLRATVQPGEELNRLVHRAQWHGAIAPGVTGSRDEHAYSVRCAYAAARIGLAYAQHLPRQFRRSRAGTRLTSASSSRSPALSPREQEFFGLMGQRMPLIPLSNFCFSRSRPDCFILHPHAYEWHAPGDFEDAQVTLLALEYLALPDHVFAAELREYVGERLSELGALLDAAEQMAMAGGGGAQPPDRASMIRALEPDGSPELMRVVDALAVIQWDVDNPFLRIEEEQPAPVGAFMADLGMSAEAARTLEAHWRKAQCLLRSLDASVTWLETHPHMWPRVVALTRASSTAKRIKCEANIACNVKQKEDLHGRTS